MRLSLPILLVWLALARDCRARRASPNQPLGLVRIPSFRCMASLEPRQVNLVIRRERVGLIDRSAQVACSMLRCRRTEARNEARGS